MTDPILGAPITDLTPAQAAEFACEDLILARDMVAAPVYIGRSRYDSRDFDQQRRSAGDGSNTGRANNGSQVAAFTSPDLILARDTVIAPVYMGRLGRRVEILTNSGAAPVTDPIYWARQ